MSERVPQQPRITGLYARTIFFRFRLWLSAIAGAAPTGKAGPSNRKADRLTGYSCNSWSGIKPSHTVAFPAACRP